jgi:hypothetical protein
MTAALVGMLATPLFAWVASAWERAVYSLTYPSACFNCPAFQMLPIISMLVGGLMFVNEKAGSKRALAVVLFGIGLIMAATNFVIWLLA